MEENIKHVKYLRVKLDEILQEVELYAKLIAVTKIDEAIMWLGKELSIQGAKTPYPESMNPSNAIVEPTADTFTAK